MQRRSILTMGAMLALTAASAGCTQSEPATATVSDVSEIGISETVTREIQQLEAEWIAAMKKKDGAWVDALLAPDYLAMSPDGAMHRREDFISLVNSGAFAPGQPWEAGLAEVNVRFFGGHTAIAYGRLKDNEHWYNDVFKKTDGRWRVIFTQVAPIPGQ